MTNLQPKQFTGYWHGTNANSEARIRKEGFDLDMMSNGRDAGDGVYVTKDQGWAAEYAFGLDDPSDWDEDRVEEVESGRILPITIDAKNPYVGSRLTPDIEISALGHTQERYPDAKTPLEYEQAASLARRGHDAWIQDGSLAVVFDPKAARVDGPARTFKDHDWAGRTPRRAYEEEQGGWENAW